MSVVREESFGGTARFSIERRLGSGGMGVVYHAYDRVRGLDVALKTLRTVDATAIYRFKKEFRALADVSHPNLVVLHELVSEGNQWFFTMELVKGATFLDYVREPQSALDTMKLKRPKRGKSAAGKKNDTYVLTTLRRSEPPATPNLIGPIGDDEDTPLDSDIHGPASYEPDALSQESTEVEDPDEAPTLSNPDSGGAPVNLPRLRAALEQLARGLNALHRAGKLHRDIKPSNVLVTPAGRVVVLDFGLVTELWGDATGLKTMDSGLAGTIAYMAPEQGANQELTPAADWYSVGVMMYEALTGHLPYTGTGIEMLMQKAARDPLPPAKLVPTIPSQLERLCLDLMNRDPAGRPSGREVLKRLGVEARPSSVSNVSIRPASAGGRAPFVGRQRHLAALEGAYKHAQRRPLALLVRGSSGVGKTALVRRFLREVATREPNVVILSGRCYERESVPFRALDSLIDSVSKHLAQIPPLAIADYLPRGIQALARLFPVLLRIEAVSKAPRLPAQTPDPQELRRRAFVALRELLTKIAASGPLVLCVDDLQWGDQDSVSLLLDLLKPPDPPRVLLLASYRLEDEDTSPVLKPLLDPNANPGVEIRTLTVGALQPEEAKELALAFLGSMDTINEARAAVIAEESGGNPFFVESLARYARKESEPHSELTLETVLRDRLQGLGEDARRLMEILAVAGRPVPEDIAFWAAGISRDEEPRILAGLRSQNLVRTAKDGEKVTVEAYHTRIREVLLAELPERVLKERHRTLANAFEASFSAEPESMYVHFREAGHISQAARYARAAGEKAAASLAFDRAAELFQAALDMIPSEKTEERGDLLAKRAEALANAGRSEEAAGAYVEASRAAHDLEARERQRRAAELYLVSGHIDQGLALMESVLRAIGLKLAGSPRAAYTGNVLRRAQIWKRGLEFKPVEASKVSLADLAEVDTLHSVAVGLAMVDSVRGADFQTRHLLRALKIGEPYRVARALALEACYAAMDGGHGRKRTARLIAEADALARKVDHPHVQGLAALAQGSAAFLAGDWRTARKLLEDTERVLRDSWSGANWEVATARTFLHASLFFLGDIGELRRRVPELIEEAEDRGDLFATVGLRTGHSSVVWLAKDEPEEARRQVDAAMARWPKNSFHLQHYLALVARAHASIYAGRGSEAYALVRQEWSGLRSSLLLKTTQYLRIDALFLRARCTLAAIAELGADKARRAPGGELTLDQVERDAQKLRDEGMRWSVPLAALLRAGCFQIRENADEAKTQLEEAITGFESANMALFAAAARVRLGDLVGGEAGRELRETGLGWMAGESIDNPNAMARMLVPG